MRFQFTNGEKGVVKWVLGGGGNTLNIAALRILAALLAEFKVYRIAQPFSKLNDFKNKANYALQSWGEEACGLDDNLAKRTKIMVESFSYN